MLPPKPHDVNEHHLQEFESSAINEEGQSHNDNLTISQDSLSLRHGLRQGFSIRQNIVYTISHSYMLFDCVHFRSTDASL